MSAKKVVLMLILVVSGMTIAKAQDAFQGKETLRVGLNKSFNSAPFNQKLYNPALTVPESAIAASGSKAKKDERKDFLERSFDIDRYYPRRGTDSFVNIYVGLNNYLEDGELPSSSSIYSLNPLTSWYAALNFDNVTHVFGPLYLDWGVGASLQDFSFENTRVELDVDRDNKTVDFVERVDRTGIKSKINAAYLNVHFVPSFSFGRYNSFRVGAGVYGGYRISSHAKYKYNDVNGDKQKDKYKESLFLNPFKYGIRAQIGWDFFDLFFNYDLTELFEEDATAPRLTPVTFGVIF